MIAQLSPSPRLINGRNLGILLLIALIIPLSTLAVARPMPNGVPLNAQPALLQVVAEHPNERVSVVVQKFVNDTSVETLTTQLGGIITKNLSIINAFAAELPGHAVIQLAGDKGVRWISLDAPIVKQACSNCVDTSSAMSSWLQSTNVREFWRTNPDIQGQSVGVAVLDSGIQLHPDVYDRITTNVMFSRPNTGDGSTPAQTRIGGENYAAKSGSAKQSGFVLNHFNAGSWVKYEHIDFGTSGASTFEAYLSTDDTTTRQSIEVRLDFPGGPLLGTLAVQNTSSASTYVLQRVAVRKAIGVRDVYLVSRGASTANVDWFTFTLTGQTYPVGDEYGHGTHIAGIIGGNGVVSMGTQIGMAPKVNLIDVRVNDAEGRGYISDVVSGLQWIYDNRTAYNIKVVNISLNSNVRDSYHTSALDAAVELLWFNGVMVVVSAGNNGNSTLYPPANDPFVLTVGATDDKGTPDRSDDTIASFSARGTDESGRTKPEIVAPGVNVTSLNCDDCTMNKTYSQNTASGFNGASMYFRASGTSMSAAVVSGAAALLMQKYPNATPDQIKYLLVTNGSTINSIRYLDVAASASVTPSSSANTGISISQGLGTALGINLWDSARWGTARWGTALWTSSSLTGDAQDSVAPSVFFGK